MGYIESLMATNERIVYRTKKHWIAPLFATLTGTLLTLGGIAALTGRLVTEGWLDQLFLWGGLLALIVGVAMLVRAFVIWWSQDYLVTNQKVMKVEGILNKKAGGAGLEKINDVTLEQNLLGRWLDFGTLRVLTAADEGDMSYSVMRRPAEFRRAMLDQKQLLDQADAHYIAEAVRGTLPQAPAAPAPHPLPSTPAQRPSSSQAGSPAPGPSDRSAQAKAPVEDIPALIARLADLHAQGALTTEEFESKKAELLRRL